MSHFLHAKEWDVDVFPSIYDGHTLDVANTAAEAISAISERDFDAYVLGIVMPRDDVDIESVRRMTDERSELAQEIARYSSSHKPIPAEIDSRYVILSDRFPDFLDYHAGERVFAYLEERGIVGVKPILFFTSQQGLNKLVRSDENKLISVAGMPTWSEELKKWFDDPYRVLDTSKK